MNPDMKDEERHNEWYLAIKRVLVRTRGHHIDSFMVALGKIKKMWSNSSNADKYNKQGTPRITWVVKG